MDKQIQMLKFYLCIVAMNDLKNNVSTTLEWVFSLTFPVQEQIERNKCVLQEEKKNHLKQMNIALSRWVIFNIIKINVFIQMGNVNPIFHTYILTFSNTPSDHYYKQKFILDLFIKWCMWSIIKIIYII